SKITDVTVHPNLASLTRAGTITLPKGKHVLILNNLPVSMTHYPFQLSAGGALLGKVTTTEVTNTHNMDARRKVLEAQLQSLEMEEQVVNDSIATAEIQIDMLKSMGQLNSAGLMTSAAADPSKWQASLDAMAKGASAAFRTIRDENAKLPELARKIRATESNLRNLGCECLTTNTLKAEIEVSGETTLNITLNYLVEGAFWEASHEVRADTDKSQIDIQSMANITQVSGEDWVDVSLTLSTIDPDSDGDFVAYLPRYVATLFDPRQQMLMERSEVRHKRAAPVSFSPAVEDILATDRSAQTVQSDFTLDYTWNKPFSLKSGGEDEIINLTAQSYSTKIFTRTTPEFSNDFFLTGTIEVGKEPLLWGEASIYLNGAYVGDFELPETYAGGTAMIPLGVDRQMGLNRVIEKSKEGDAGIFGGKR
ncbi:MAG: mucoidy inhibitor MuiA family protein, partial [Sphingomonadales bacterium]|nr:mucoidy inhibitor MuiA family protein [Sphingomonadales bacterium]